MNVEITRGAFNNRMQYKLPLEEEKRVHGKIGLLERLGLFIMRTMSRV
jgi:hypothetical protein